MNRYYKHLPTKKVYVLYSWCNFIKHFSRCLSGGESIPTELVKKGKDWVRINKAEAEEYATKYDNKNYYHK